MTKPTAPQEARFLSDLEAMANAEIRLPADAHVIGEPVTVTRIRYSGSPRAGLLATCFRRDLEYELSLADVVFPAPSAGAAIVARYREWLGLAPLVAPAAHTAQPHKVETDEIAVGVPVELVVLVSKTNALRCRLIGSAREVTLRTAVWNESPGFIITVIPKKVWTHARHPYLSGEVTSVRIDASVLGLEPLALYREDTSAGMPSIYRLGWVTPENDDAEEQLLEARECLDEQAYAEADDLLRKVIALDLRYLEAHALLGERHLSSWPSLAHQHFELGVAIGSLSVREELNGELPWACFENRPFLRCLHGFALALLYLERRAESAAALQRLLRLDPADHLGARETLAAIEAGKTSRELEAGR